MKRALLLILALSGVEGLGGCGPTREDAKQTIAPFVVDVTPPIGHPLVGGWVDPARTVEAPLLLKGVVLDDGRSRVVLGALDWCVLSNKAYALFRKRIAEAVDTPLRNVSLHCTHTHSAPMADAGAQELIDATAAPLPHLDLAWLEKVVRATSDAVRAAAPVPFTHVGVGKAKVEGFASNRRLLVDGKAVTRFSSAGKDPKMREAAEGLIDPWLRTLTFLDGPRPLARLHYYATHPQTSYGKGQVSPDVVGHAREYLQSEEGVFQIYFAGCGGDVTAGKYNDGGPEDRARLAKAIYVGMLRSVESTSSVPVRGFEWTSTDLPLTSRVNVEETRKVLEDVAQPKQARLIAACKLSWVERAKTPLDIGRLRIGPADVVHLPGEPFVAYQLYAQSLKPERFVAVAGYGEGGPWYVCTDAAYGEGGYEPGVSWVGPGIEKTLKAAIAEALR